MMISSRSPRWLATLASLGLSLLAACDDPADIGQNNAGSTAGQAGMSGTGGKSGAGSQSGAGGKAGSPAKVCDPTSPSLQTDKLNCGTCGHQCTASQQCVGGTCKFQCSAGQESCGAGCVDLTSNPLHCGACGVACPLGFVCAGSSCRNPCDEVPGTTLCGTQCASTTNDKQNCGACGMACPLGFVCVDSGCRNPCDEVPGTTLCGTQCANTMNDGQNCGSCGNACPQGSQCTDGVCCAKELTTCSGACVDVQTSDAHCNGCGQACTPEQVCVQGTCQTGTPTFDLVTGEDTGFSVGNMFLGDLDGDGHLDLCANAYDADIDNEVVLTMRGKGDGTFEAPVLVNEAGHVPVRRMVDLDGDGHLDLVLLNEGFSLPQVMYIVWGKGDGTFSEPDQLAPGHGIGLLDVGDVDGDGKLDIFSLTGVSGQPQSSLLRNEGNRAFALEDPFKEGNLGHNNYGIALRDMNNDGRADLILLSKIIEANIGVVQVHLSEQGGVFPAISPFYSNLDVEPRGLLVGDTNGDGRDDVLVGCAADKSLSVALNEGNDFAYPAASNPIGGWPRLFALVDMNGDGTPDLTYRRFFTDDGDDEHVYLALGQGKGKFSQPIPWPAAMPKATAAAVGDLDGDGRPDLLVASPDGTLTTLLNKTLF